MRLDGALLRVAIVSSTLVASGIWPDIGRSQDTLAEAAERESELLERIEREEQESGPYSRDLIGPLTSLRLHYDEIGEHDLAESVTDDILQVLRANYGLHSLEQAATIKQLMSRKLAQGQIDEAWNLEQELLVLASRNPDDLRAARILRDIGDRRLDILERFDADEFPREITLGCYYDDSLAYQEAWLRGSRPLSSYPGDQQVGRDCESGSRSRARRALVNEAQLMYAVAANIHFRSEESTGDELKTLLTRIRDSSFRYGTPGIGRSSLQYLIDYEAENATSWLSRIDAIVQLADWEILYTSDFGTKLRDSALASYQHAYGLAVEQGVPAESVDSIFSPDIPIRLPSVLPSPLVSPDTDDSGPYIDISFVVTTNGKADDIEVVNSSPDVSRAEQRDLIQLVKRSRFRPQFTNGQLADSEPLLARYKVPG